MMTVVACQKCGASIHPDTANSNGGLCMPCSGRKLGRARIAPEEAQRDVELDRRIAERLARMPVESEEQALSRTGAFKLALLQHDASSPNKYTSWPNHELVLRPLLEASEEVWAYAGKPGSRAERAASGLLQLERGKYRVLIEGEPIIGRETFWNATGGDRGSIVFVVPKAQFAAERLFSHCWGPDVMVNFTAAHTPSAVRYARSKVSDESNVVCMLSRNSGFESLFVLAAPGVLGSFYDIAKRCCLR